jgi:hypothetical protein
MKKVVLGAVFAVFFGPGQAFAGEDDFMLSVGNGLGFAGMAKTPAVDVGTRIGVRRETNTFFGIVDYFRVAGEVDGDDSVSVSLTTVGVGVRHDLRSAKPREASPYLVGGVYTALPSTSDNDLNNELDELKTMGAFAGVGGEYLFDTSFSISAEVGVQRFAVLIEADGLDLTGAVTNSYSGFQINMYL